MIKVTNISRHGLWLLCRDRVLFMSFSDFPWFKDAPVASILHVEEPSPNHFHWPDLDIDVGMSTIEDPQRFPLVAKQTAGRASYGTYQRQLEALGSVGETSGVSLGQRATMKEAERQ